MPRTGVEPNVKVAAEHALATAHLMALEELAQATQEPAIRAEVASAIKILKAGMASEK